MRIVDDFPATAAFESYCSANILNGNLLFAELINRDIARICFAEECYCFRIFFLNCRFFLRAYIFLRVDGIFISVIEFVTVKTVIE